MKNNEEKENVEKTHNLIKVVILIIVSFAFIMSISYYDLREKVVQLENINQELRKNLTERTNIDSINFDCGTTGGTCYMNYPDMWGNPTYNNCIMSVVQNKK